MNEIAPITGIPSAAAAKWSVVLMAGFQLLPDTLLKNQARLGLSPTDLGVLLNVLSHWWYKDQLPYPKSSTIARRMGVTPRTVQRSLQRLERRGFLRREKGATKTEPARLDPSGLVEQLKPYAKADPSYARRRLKAEIDDMP